MLANTDTERYERAALRWLQRLIDERLAPPTELPRLAAKVIAASRAASTVAGLAQEFLTADGQTFNVALDATLGSAAWLAESGGYAAVDDTISLVLADFKTAYGIRRVNDVSIQRQDELHSDLGQIGFRGWSRVDGRVLIADAARILQHSAT